MSQGGMPAFTPSWRWRVERAWVVGSLKWWAWGLGVCLAVAALLACLVVWRQVQREGLSVQAELARISAQPVPAPAPVADPSDFARDLGKAVPAAHVIQELQRACAEAGVVLAGIQAQERLPSVDQLGRLQLAVTLRGGYVASKQVLKRVADRYPQLTVQRLRMQRGAAGSEVESQVVLSLWAPPLLAREAAK